MVQGDVVVVVVVVAEMLRGMPVVVQRRFVVEVLFRQSVAEEVLQEKNTEKRGCSVEMEWWWWWS